jgi:hypothetical protein
LYNSSAFPFKLDNVGPFIVTDQYIDRASGLTISSVVGLPYLVYQLEAYANNKAVDGALKQVKLMAPETPTIFFSGTDRNQCLNISLRSSGRTCGESAQ